ncbi:MAG: hypothetical protein FJ267_17195 [Planctomycetes bacterium]|nr:hypothetical protein [Planctomycetota bacterium]
MKNAASVFTSNQPKQNYRSRAENRNAKSQRQKLVQNKYHNRDVALQKTIRMPLDNSLMPAQSQANSLQFPTAKQQIPAVPGSTPTESPAVVSVVDSEKVAERDSTVAEGVESVDGRVNDQPLKVLFVIHPSQKPDANR